MKTLVRSLLAAALFAATAAATTAHAADGDDYRFKIINKSTQPAIQFFTKRVNGTWSNDWLTTPIAPGATRGMHFNEGDTRCKVQTRIVFGDASEFNTPVDYCGIDAVIVTDKSLFTQ